MASCNDPTFKEPKPVESSTITEPKTVVDVEIETLKKQITDMQSRYDKAIADYQNENRKLYTHAVGNDDSSVSKDVPVFDYGKAETVCYKYLGLE